MKAYILLSVLLGLPAVAQDWRPLFNGKDLAGWRPRGECIWTVMEGGILLGQRLHAQPASPFEGKQQVDDKSYQKWLYRQAWLYTEREFRQFDLSLEYWVPPGVNSGVSIRDVSRAHFAIGDAGASDPPLPAGMRGTPAHIGYEIQIIDSDTEKYPTGSIYTFVAAPGGLQKMGAWNRMEIESRDSGIRVKVNGRPAAEFAGEAGRPMTGPIGLQLHDQFTFMMFRNIRIRELASGGK